MPAAKKPPAKNPPEVEPVAPEAEEADTQPAAEPDVAPDPTPALAPAKPKTLADYIEAAERAAESLVGHSKVVHQLEVAFIHALTGAKADAENALAEAEDEIAKFEALVADDVKGIYALLKARVHAALASK